MQTYLVAYHRKGQSRSNTILLKAQSISNLRVRLIHDISWNDLYVGNLSSKGYAPSVTVYQVQNENTHAMAKGKIPADIFKAGNDYYWWSFRDNKPMTFAKKINPKTGVLTQNKYKGGYEI